MLIGVLPPPPFIHLGKIDNIHIRDVLCNFCNPLQPRTFREFHRIEGAPPDNLPDFNYDGPEEVCGNKKLFYSALQKSRIRETEHRSTDADSSTDIIKI